MNNYKIKTSKTTINKLISYLIKLGFWLDVLYASFLVDPDDIFYSDKNVDDIKLLEDRVKVIRPDNLQKHLK